MSVGQSERRDERPTVIDAEEFEAALSDPRVHEFWAEAEAYAQELIERGHCPRCLVINCEHIRGA